MTISGPPNSIPPSHLQDGRLLNTQQVALVEAYFQQNPSAVFFPGNEQVPFPVAKTEDDQLLVLFAKQEYLFRNAGELEPLKKQIKEQKEKNPDGVYPLGIGRDGIVVAAQSLRDGSWIATKFETNPEAKDSSRIETILMEQEALKTQQDLFKGSAVIERTVNNIPHTTVMTAMKLGPGQDLNVAMVKDGINILDLDEKLELGFKVGKSTGNLVKKNIIHRDFKPNNIMANIKSREVMLIDFGGAARGDKNGNYVETVPIGTPGYLAPELATGAFFVNKKTHSESTMAFALGISLAEMYTKNNIRAKDENWQTHYQDLSKLPLPNDFSFGNILGCFHDVLGDKPEEVSKKNVIEREMHLVVGKLIHLDPNQRLSINLATKELAVIKDYHDLLKKHGISLNDHKEAASLLEHMRNIRHAHPDNKDLINNIHKLEEKFKRYQRHEVKQQASILSSRVDLYTKNVKEKDPVSQKHKATLEKYSLQLKFASRLPNAEKKCHRLRNKIYIEKSKYEITKAFGTYEGCLKSLEKYVDKSKSATANEMAQKIKEKLSQKKLSNEDISKLYQDMAAFKQEMLNIRKPLTQQESTRSIVTELGTTEKELSTYMLSHEQAQRVSLKESKPKDSPATKIARKLTSFIEERRKEIKSTLNNQDKKTERTTSVQAPSDSIRRDKIQFLLDFYESGNNALTPLTFEQQKARQSDLNRYAKDSDPIVAALALAIKAKQNGEPIVFRAKMAEFKQGLNNVGGEMVNFVQKVSGKVARLETQTQSRQNGFFNQKPTVRELPQPKQDFSQEAISKCKQALKEVLSDLYSSNSKVNYHYKDTTERVVNYINASLSSNIVTQQTIAALHQQTQHIWKEPDKSPLANLMNEKNELKAVETSHVRNRLT